ncbi:MAG: hypothetical protein JXA03_10740 [Bacteroidales bacterium]|nr:hypothetical protein [Bacteroidales bacterium]
MADQRITDVNLIVPAFGNLKVLIVGDIMVDSYVMGKVERISPEAPVPIVLVTKRENRLGGAANVALNIKSLKAEPYLCSVIGTDKKGDEFLEILQQEGMSPEGIVRSTGRVTTTKFRVIGNKVQMLRVDEESLTPVSSIEREELAKKYSAILRERKIDVVIFQDYDKGVISKELIGHFVSLAREAGVPVAVDPKRKNFMDYRNVDLFKPNLKELKEGLKFDFDHKKEGELERAVDLLREKINARIIMVTLSEDGVFTSYRNNDENSFMVIPSHVRQVADVSGAGDTVISVAALCLALKTEPFTLAFVSNIAGGLVCEEAGVVPVNREKLIRELAKINKARFE